MFSLQDKVYNFMDINEMSEMANSPVEITTTNSRTKKEKKFVCGKIELKDEERKNGWCATKLDSKGRSISEF